MRPGMRHVRFPQKLRRWHGNRRHRDGLDTNWTAVVGLVVCLLILSWSLGLLDFGAIDESSRNSIADIALIP